MTDTATKPTRFSAAERNLIRRSAVGKPTGVIVSVGGFDLDLVPLTVSQSSDIGEIIDALQGVAKDFKDGKLNAAPDVAMAALSAETKRVTGLMKSVLFETALASDLIDESDSGVEVFDEWFSELPMLPTLLLLFKGVVDASGVAEAFGNPSTPVPEAVT
jgi:hypothetical protein